MTPVEFTEAVRAAVRTALTPPEESYCLCMHRQGYRVSTVAAKILFARNAGV